MENANREPNEVMLEDVEPTIKDCVGWLRNKWKMSWDLAEDVASKVRIKIHVEGEKITEQPKAYVKKVFFNAGADYFRSKKARGLDDAQGVASPSRTPDDSIEECKARAWYKALTPSQKEIADLFLEGWDRDQVREQIEVDHRGPMVNAMQAEQAIQSRPPTEGAAEIVLQLRIELAQAAAKIVGMVAAERGLDRKGACQIQADLVRRLLSRVVRCPIDVIHTGPFIDRLERMAERLVDRELLRRANERRKYGVELLDDEDCRRILRSEPRTTKTVNVALLFEVWMSLNLAEQRALRLEDLSFDNHSSSQILGIPVDEVETLRGQAHAKIRQAYQALC